MFFTSSDEIIRIIVTGTMAYIGLLILLRASGKRTLSQMNAYDLVVTVSLGSILATIILDSTISLSEGVTAFTLLILLQTLLSWLSLRSNWFAQLIKSKPELLYYEGEFLYSIMEKKRIQEEEVLQSARSQGIYSTHQVEAVVLEADGSISVIKKSNQHDHLTIRSVK